MFPSEGPIFRKEVKTNENNTKDSMVPALRIHRYGGRAKMSIDIKKLTEADIGREVKYKPKHITALEQGRIKFFNDTWVFVVYHCDNDWDNYWNYTAAPTDPKDLIFLETEAEGKNE